KAEGRRQKEGGGTSAFCLLTSALFLAPLLRMVRAGHAESVGSGDALAMVQDTRAMLQLFNARIDDPDVRNIINKYHAQFDARQRDANHLLSELGGPPWPSFEP
ncbi:MAG TPA: hypothetical protein VKU62_06430, partial [Thermoanaerobaculia bacterium]|nr:hypothetical protein [Thermoanaerobaculia bacterium]